MKCPLSSGIPSHAFQIFPCSTGLSASNSLRNDSRPDLLAGLVPKHCDTGRKHGPAGKKDAQQPVVHFGDQKIHKGIGIGWYWLSLPGWFKHQLVDFNVRRASNFTVSPVYTVNDPTAGHLFEKLMLLRAIELLAMNSFGQTKFRQ